MEILSPEDLVSRLSDGRSVSKAFCPTRADTEPLPPMVLGQPRNGSPGLPLIFFFHGAVNREVRSVPVFEGRFLRGAVDGTIISLADPSLTCNDGLRACWYQGSESRNVSEDVALFIASCISELEPSRVVFAGGSIGGHPAMYHSYRVPGSVFVTQNPILAISRYNPRFVAEYRAACWPNLAADSALPKKLTLEPRPASGPFPSLAVGDS